MRKLAIIPAILLCGLTLTASADTSSAMKASSKSNAVRVPLSELLESVTDKTGQRFLIEERVPKNVVVTGLSMNGLDTADLMHILDINGLAAVHRDDITSIIPNVNIRNKAIRLVDGTEKDLLDAEWVTYVLRTNRKDSEKLVPALRPLISQAGHMAPLPGSGKLLLVERWEVIKRIEAIVNGLTESSTR
ncbi:MAG: hypothetical protein AB8G18_07045 [Gammaproteobacteria bacterium]